MFTSEFGLYLRLGFDHIADLSAYDHILFVIALAAVYSVKEWKHMLVLVTAFTIGHSITLAMATLGVLVFNEALIETLIPITIFITAALNVIERIGKEPEKAIDRDWKFKYFLALFFGLIHGLGFSYYLRAILGGESSIIFPLFSFNVGLELGQLVILVITLSFGTVIVWLINRALSGTNFENTPTQGDGTLLRLTASNVSIWYSTVLSAVIAVWSLTMIPF